MVRGGEEEEGLSHRGSRAAMCLPDVDNLSIPLGGARGNELQVGIRTRPARAHHFHRDIARRSQTTHARHTQLDHSRLGPASGSQPYQACPKRFQPIIMSTIA